MCTIQVVGKAWVSVQAGGRLQIWVDCLKEEIQTVCSVEIWETVRLLPAVKIKSRSRATRAVVREIHIVSKVEVGPRAKHVGIINRCWD